MKFNSLAWLIPGSFIFLMHTPVEAKHFPIETIQRENETKIRHLLEPLLDKYCREQCKFMSVHVNLDIAKSDSISPGFDEPGAIKMDDLEPTSAQVKVLIDDKVGPISRRKLQDLMQEYLDTLDYPVKIETQITHFPLPQGSEGKIAEMKERISKKFLQVMDDILKQYCPQHCQLADFDFQTDVVNAEESQYGSPGEFIQDGETALKIKNISATLLMDESLSSMEQASILQLAKLKTNSFKNVNLTGKSIRFPKPVYISPRRSLAAESSEETNKNSKETNSSTESNVRQEKVEKVERIERVENGDAVQAELQKFKLFGLIFAFSILAMLIFIVMNVMRPSQSKDQSTIHRVFQTLTNDSSGGHPLRSSDSSSGGRSDTQQSLIKRYEIERLLEELVSIFAEQPRVAKQVFTRVLTEEGIEVAAQYIHIFGESIVIEMLRDPSLQSDMSELMEYYSKTPIDLNDDLKLELLKRLHNRSIAGKLAVMGSRSSQLFDFLTEMDGLQILELIRTESLTVKSIVLTQCDLQKRAIIYSQLESDTRMALLTELSRVDYLPRDYIFNVASALKRKRLENPKLNTEALPGSEVLVSLLERTGHDLQKTVVKNLELSSPDSARVVKSKLVSIETLKYLRDGQLLEVVLNLKHEELIQFLKGASADVKSTIFSKAPKELVLELEDELDQASAISRETYLNIERKLLNRMKIMANEGHINLIETNERMFSNNQADATVIQTSPGMAGLLSKPTRKVI